MSIYFPAWTDVKQDIYTFCQEEKITGRKAQAPWSAPTSAGGPDSEVVL
ncbi:hypothetical protein SAMD00020551_4250 [Mesobacillus selenatarsenatis SF-1]|uniref:Uncharacterized protein n=1 Tax=Mesobacillus selenatarsenatis (strain DSM 18680 / JCM 14380 / FERM P-15431 / SF-1) TaxID=1321606 RepID=A0A0A8XAK7_MESS1|nr:hypothetical protein SAMD00020551_4250 [Mesobacillus selenatarsenatis SF-1]